MEDRYGDDEEFNMEEIMARHEAMEEELEQEEIGQLRLSGIWTEPEGEETVAGEGQTVAREGRTAAGEDRAAAGEGRAVAGDEPEKSADAPEGLYPESDWEAIIEAVLFTMGGSVELKQLAAAIDQDKKMAWQAVQKLKQRYEAENRGMQIIELEDSVQMCTRNKFYENLIRVASTPKKQVLTDVVLETLSIIAYKQPVTKMEIEKIRGVKSDHAVNRLIEYNLVYEAGRLDAPGRPALFATTEEFLRRFGIGSAGDLPEPDPEQIEEFKEEAEEELHYQAEPEDGSQEALKEAAAAKAEPETEAAAAKTMPEMEAAAEGLTDED